ncbi:MAG: NAD(P)H-dependent glycerol-3-phosphate dehydrogenase [Candidatus Cryosericum sp.]
MTRVCVVGAGAWGTTIANVAAVKAAVTLWVHGRDTLAALRDVRENTLYLPGVPLQDNVEPTDDLMGAWRSADAIILAVPTQKLRSMFRKLAPELCRPSVPLLNLSKGLELETHLRVSQLLCEDLELSDYDHYATLSGPNFASEIARNMPAATVIAGRRPGTRRYFQELLSGASLRPYTSADLVGVELGGALKNVYAVAAGVSDGLGFGDSSKATLIVRSLHELVKVATELGADPATINGLAGAGDLIATSFSRLSRNRMAGEAIGRGTPASELQTSQRTVIEGLPTLEALAKIAELSTIDLPIVRQLHGIVAGSVTPLVGLQRLMSRETKNEF